MSKNGYCIPSTNTIAKPWAQHLGGAIIYKDTGIPCTSPNYDFSVSNPGRVVGEQSRGWTISSNYPSSVGGGDVVHGLGGLGFGSWGRGGDGSRSGGGGSGSSGIEPKTHPSDSPQEKALAVNVAQKITPYLLQLNLGEGSLGIHTASFSGRKSKDGDAISNQMKGCFSYIKINGGIDTLRLLTFRECDLTEIDMIYFGNEMSKYSVLLKYLDFSYNRIGDLGTTYLFNSFFTYPTGQFAKHVVHLDLSNTVIGDNGAAHIAGYIKGGYMPATKVLNLADNNITDTGAAHLAEGLKSEGNKLNIIHLEGNRLTSTGEGFLVIALQNVTQSIKVVLKEVKGFSKDSLKVAMKAMLSVAKSNGITTKEMLTNDETIEYCKKGVVNVGLNITTGIVKCTKTPVKYLTPKDVNLQDVILDGVSNIKEARAIITFYCITQNTFFSIVDEEFANCLTGLDSMLDE